LAYSFPTVLVIARIRRGEEPSGEKSSALILDPFSDANFVKISPACQENRGNRESPMPVPETQSAFHPHAQRNVFRRRDVRHKDVCLAAARIFGWQGEGASVAVNVDNRQVIVSPEERARLQAQLKRLQESEPAAITLPQPQTQPQANVSAGNDPPAPASKQDSEVGTPAGAKDPAPSPSYLIWKDYKRPEEEQEEPTADISNVGW
jgi:hypothetical protein